MDNFDLREYLSNNPLLNEIKISSPGGILFPERFMDDFETMTEGYLEGSSSPEDILDPEGEIYDMDRFEDYEADDPQFIAFQNLINNLPSRTYYIKNWFGFTPAPGAPQNSFDTQIIITPNKEIKVYTAAMNYDGKNTGWFDDKGKYYPDLEHFDEEGNAI